MKGPLRTGLLGFGLAGRVFHAPLIAANDAFALTHIVTSDPTRQEQAERTYPDATVVATPSDFWSAGLDLDLIVVASPPVAHLEQGLRALESGSAVVIDKPFALSSADANQLIRTAARTGYPLAVFQNRRWDGDFLTVRRLLKNGRLGSVHTFNSSFERSWPLESGHWRASGRSAGSGILFDIGAHLIDQALELFGDVEEVTAELRIIDPQSVSDDSAVVSLWHRSGVRSHLSMSRTAELGAPRFQVLGTRGAYRVDGIDGQEDALSTGVRPGDINYGVSAEEGWGTLSVDGAVSTLPTLGGDYPAFYAGMAASLLHGEAPPVSADAALRALQIIEDIYRTVPMTRWPSR